MSSLDPSRAFVPWLLDTQVPVALVCFHCAGGSAQSFFHWKQHAKGVCDLWAAELPGRSRRYNEPYAKSVQQIATEFAQTIVSLSNKPMVFFGHSLGALLAYETIRSLELAGAPLPRKLIVSSRQGATWLPPYNGLPNLNETALREYMSSLDGTPKAVLENSSLMEIALPILKSDLELIYRYTHKPGVPLTIPIEAWGGIDDGHVKFESLASWEASTSSEFSLKMVPGGHFAVMEQAIGVMRSAVTAGP